MSSHWRQAGMTYLQYVNRAAHVMRTCLKEPMKSKALKNNKVHFRERAYQDGKKIDPVFVEGVGQKGTAEATV